jgi:probable O-glycosylation ligase (exosortase A-associated)
MEAAATTAIGWWRSESVASPVEARASGSRVAFGALIVFTGVLVLSPQAWFPILGTIRIAFLAAGTAIFAHLLHSVVTRRGAEPLHFEMAIALALVGWAIVTIPLSYWPGGSIAELTERFLKAVAFCWLIGAIVTTRERLRTFLWVLVLCATPLAITALQNYQDGRFLFTGTSKVQRIAGYNDEGGSGIAANPNDLALVLNLMIPLAVMLLATSRRMTQRALAAGALVLSVAAVIVTFSRAGFLTLAATLLLLVPATARRQPWAALAVLSIALAAAPVLPESYLSRLGTITNLSADPTGSAQGRWKDLSAALDVVAHQPITGVGLGQNILALNQTRGETWRAVHNVYLQFAVDLGIPGLLLFLWLFAAVFRAAGKVRRRAPRDRAGRDLALIATGVQISLVAYAVSAFFHPSAYQFYFFSVAGLALAVKNVAAANAADRSPAGDANGRSSAS